MMMTDDNRPVTSVTFDGKIVAKMVRKALKVAFPGVKFGVTLSRYAGGSSINIASAVMTPGAPSTAALWQFGKLYSTWGFDGMTDSTTNDSKIIDGLKVDMYSACRGQTDYRGGVELTEADMAAAVLVRDALVREFMPMARKYAY